MWPHQKDCSTRWGNKKVFLAHSPQLAVQYNYRSMPEGLILSQTSAFRLPLPFLYHGHASLEIDQVRVWNDVLPRGTSLFRIISPVISRNRLLAGGWKKQNETRPTKNKINKSINNNKNVCKNSCFVVAGTERASSFKGTSFLIIFESKMAL